MDGRLLTPLPIAKRWGGGPSNEDSTVEGFGTTVVDPSTMSLRAMVPLPTSFARRDERK